MAEQLLEKNAVLDLAGAATYGALRSSRLSDEEKSKLRKKHNLEDNANLEARNMGRGLAGYLGGTFATGAVGTPLGLQRKQLIVPALALGAAGAHLSTNKYSRKSDRLK